MYQITAGLRVISHMPPDYRCKHANGFFLPCSEEQAQAILVGSELYAIDPDVPVPDHPDAELAIIRTIPDDSYTDELLDAKREHTTQIGDLETGTAELADTVEATAADTMDGLCELADTVEIATTELQDGLTEQADTMMSLLDSMAEALNSHAQQIQELEDRIAALEAQKEATNG